MKRCLPLAHGLLVISISMLCVASDIDPNTVKVRDTSPLEFGAHRVVIAVYASESGGEPVQVESRQVQTDRHGEFTVSMANVASDEDRWVAVKIDHRREAPRVKLSKASAKLNRIAIQVVTPALIHSDGMIESAQGGYRFPDGSIQATAVVGAGINSHGTTHAPAGADPVPTDVPVAIGSANSSGVANALARADHVHAHGNQAGGALHAAATTGGAGFMSAADKTKLNGAPSYVRTIVVTPTPGSSNTNGTALITALNGISGNGVSDPYLLKLEPGIYDIGNNTLTMKSYVDIEGSGQDTTFIRSSRSQSLITTSAAAIVGASNSELRDVTVTNVGNATENAVGYFATNFLSASIRHVTFNVSGGTSFSIGVISSNSLVNSLTLDAVTINVTGMLGSTTTGLEAGLASTVTVRDCTITVSAASVANRAIHGGSSTAVLSVDSSVAAATGTTGNRNALLVDNGTVTVTNSLLRADGSGSGALTAVKTANSASALAFLHRCSIKGTDNALDKGLNSTLRVAASMVDTYGLGSPTCIFTYDSNFVSNNCGPPPV